MSKPFRPSDLDDRCCVAPEPAPARTHPRARAQLQQSPGVGLGGRIVIQPQNRPGFNDGLIIPGTEYPLGTPLRKVRRAAATRAPLRGTVRVIVVLVDFTDAPMTTTPAHFRDLFFSTGQDPDRQRARVLHRGDARPDDARG